MHFVDVGNDLALEVREAIVPGEVRKRKTVLVRDINSRPFPSIIIPPFSFLR